MAEEKKEGKAVKKPHPFAMFPITLMVLGMLAGFCQSYIKAHSNPDTRTPKEMAHDYLEYRGKYLKASKGQAKKPAVVNDLANGALCVLNQMGHPLGKAYTGKDAEKIPEDRGAHDDFTWEDEKYIYSETEFTHTNENRIKGFDATVAQMKKDDRVKKDVAWFTMTPEEYRKTPMKCAKDHNGECIRDYDNRECLFHAPLAEQVTKANAEFYKFHNRDFKPIVCWRSNLHQAVSYYGGENKCNVKKAAGNMPPGNSSHGMGNAMDLPDKEAHDFLAEIGMACGDVPGDPDHCSFGESSMNKHLFASYKRRAKKGWKLIKKYAVPGLKKVGGAVKNKVRGWFR